jgi:flagellar biosynthesis GTPase FlhF
LTPKDDGFNYLDWLNSVARIFWTRLKDEEIDFLQMKPIVEKLLKEYQDLLAAQHPDKKWYAAQLKKLKRRPLAPEQLAKRHQREDERAERQKAEYESQLKERQEQKSQEEKQKELECRKEEENRLKLISIMVNGKEPSFVSYWQDNYESILVTLKAEGKSSISWKEFQTRWSYLAATYGRYIIPLIKNGMISLADLVDVEPVLMFSLSLGLWTGSQRLFQNSPQLVFKINSQRLYTRFADENMETRKAVNEALLNFSSGHPVDNWNVGWLRVHKDGANKLAFIDEVQSDALEELRETYHPSKDRRQYLTYRIKKLKFLNELEVRRIERALRPWNLHGFASVKHWAHSMGYRAAIHSRESAQKKPGMTQSDRKWNTYYAPIISQYRLTAESVPGYLAQIMVERV